MVIKFKDFKKLPNGTYRIEFINFFNKNSNLKIKEISNDIVNFAKSIKSKAYTITRNEYIKTINDLINLKFNEYVGVWNGEIEKVTIFFSNDESMVNYINYCNNQQAYYDFIKKKTKIVKKPKK